MRKVTGAKLSKLEEALGGEEGIGARESVLQSMARQRLRAELGREPTTAEVWARAPSTLGDVIDKIRATGSYLPEEA